MLGLHSTVHPSLYMSTGNYFCNTACLNQEASANFYDNFIQFKLLEKNRDFKIHMVCF